MANKPRLDEDVDLVKLVMERHQSARDAKSEVMLDMELDYRRWSGETFAHLDRKKGAVIAPGRELEDNLQKERNFFAIKKNKLRKSCGKAASLLTQRQPQLYCNPMTSSDQAKKRAKIWTEVLTQYRLRKQYMKKNLKTAEWTTVTGIGYKWVHPIQVNGRWEVDILVGSGFSFGACPGVEDINDMPWITWAHYESKETLQAKYPDLKFSGVGGEDDSLADVMRLVMNTESLKSQCLVIEYLERPQGTGRGRRVVVCESQALDQNEFPYWNMEGGQEVWGGYRISTYRYNPNLISHWATGLPYEVRILHKRISDLLGQWFTYMVLTAAPKLFKKGKMPEKLEDNFPGVFQINDLEEVPRWMDTPKNSPEMKAMLEVLESSYEDLTFQPTSMGQEPLQRIPYLSVQFLTEMDTQANRIMFDHWEESERETGWNLVNALFQYGKAYQGQPLIGILGKSRADDVARLLSDDPSDLELNIEPGSSQPQSRAGQIGSALDSLKYGAFDMARPEDRLAFARAMDSGWSKGMIEDITRSSDFAAEENQILLAGPSPTIPGSPPQLDPATGQPLPPQPVMVPVSPHHNHPAHINEHRKPLDGPDYHKIAGTIIEEGFNQHIGLHQAFMAPPMPPPGPPGQPGAAPPGPLGGGMPPGVTPEMMAAMAAGGMPMGGEESIAPADLEPGMGIGGMPEQFLTA